MSYPDILLEDTVATPGCARALRRNGRARERPATSWIIPRGPLGKFALGPLEGEQTEPCD